MPLTKSLLSVSHVGCSAIVFICILQQSCAVGILLKNSTVQVNLTTSAHNTNGTVNHTNGTVNHTNGTVYHTNGTVNHTNRTVYHTNGTVYHTNGTVYHTNETVNHTNETAKYINETFNYINGTVYHTNGTAVKTPLRSNSNFSIATRSLGKRKKYYISKIKASWLRAMQLCREYNMRLASINNLVQQGILEHDISKSGIGNSPVWISGTDLDQKGKYFWISTGHDISAFKNWRLGQPDNHNWGDHMGVEHCVEVSPAHNYRWSDFTCYAKQYFACDYF